MTIKAMLTTVMNNYVHLIDKIDDMIFRPACPVYAGMSWRRVKKVLGGGWVVLTTKPQWF